MVALSIDFSVLVSCHVIHQVDEPTHLSMFDPFASSSPLSSIIFLQHTVLVDECTSHHWLEGLVLYDLSFLIPQHY